MVETIGLEDNQQTIDHNNSQLTREQIVTNGCSGSCCERFSLPFSLKELQDSSKAQHAGEFVFIDRNGKEQHTVDHANIDYIIDMLIPLEYSNMSAEHKGKSLRKLLEELNPGVVIEPDIVISGGDIDENGEVWKYYFTCRHFDKEKRICGAYETRPSMCRIFGRHCKYEGCGFQSTLSKLEEITEL